jgi:hypothetical protein
VRGTWIADLNCCAEHLRKSDRVRWRWLQRLWRGALAGTLLAARSCSTMIDAIAEFFLGRTDLGQKRDWIERAILFAQPLLHGRSHVRMRQRPLLRDNLDETGATIWVRRGGRVD